MGGVERVQVLGIDSRRVRRLEEGRGTAVAADASVGRRRRIGAFCFGRVHLEYDAELLEVVLARRAPGCFARAGERREQDGRQDRDDRNHDQQFDEGEAAAFHGTFPSRIQTATDGINGEMLGTMPTVIAL